MTREEEVIRDEEQIDRELDKEQHEWERRKTNDRDAERRRIAGSRK